VTAQAVENLKAHGLTVENIIATPVAKIDALISKVGFHSRKAEYLKKCAEIIHEKHGGKIPETLKELLDLPGIGPKMAHLILQVSGRGIGIGKMNRIWGKESQRYITHIHVHIFVPLFQFL
jgi:endonuclease-3